tara:strand:+ start:725 stop:835 length:111 start_codon:yes stop_codon:yes gene_type:complete
MDGVTDGMPVPVISETLNDLKDRSNQLKYFAYFNDI